MLRLANAGGVLASAVFAVVGVRRPGYVMPEGEANPLAAFWAQAAAARTLPLACVLLYELARESPRSLHGLLLVAGLAQAGDAALGVRRRNPGMTLAPATLAALHLLSARRSSPAER